MRDEGCAAAMLGGAGSPSPWPSPGHLRSGSGEGKPGPHPLPLSHREYSRRARGEIAQHRGLAEAGLAAFGQLQGEEPFVDDVAQTVHDPRAVEVDPCGRVMGQAIEAGPALEILLGQLEGVTADCLEERMAGRDPLQVVFLGRFPMRGKRGILGR